MLWCRLVGFANSFQNPPCLDPLLSKVLDLPLTVCYCAVTDYGSGRVLTETSRLQYSATKLSSHFLFLYVRVKINSADGIIVHRYTPGCNHVTKCDVSILLYFAHWRPKLEARLGKESVNIQGDNPLTVSVFLCGPHSLQHLLIAKKLWSRKDVDSFGQ